MNFSIKGSFVSFKEFLHSEDILGEAAGSVYPQWEDRLCRFMATGKRILVLFGSYAIGKSYISKILLLWNLYVITKIDNIRKVFNKAASDIIVLQLFSPTKGDVGSLDLEGIKEMLSSSPYFSRVCPIIRMSKNSILLRGGIRIEVSSRRGDSRSKQLFFASLDEGNFLSENSAISFRRAREIYTEVYTRIHGRWALPKEFGMPFMGMIVLASSADSDDSFIESAIKDGVRSGEVHVERMANYDIDPVMKDEQRFSVFIGDGDVSPHIMEYPPEGCAFKNHYKSAALETVIENLLGVSYDEFMASRSDKIEHPPISLRGHYERDVSDALQVFSGRSQSSSIRLFKSIDPIIASIHPTLKNPLLYDDIPLVMGDTTEFSDCVDMGILRSNYRGGSVFYHIDQSKSTDPTGVVFVEKDAGTPFRILLAFRIRPSKQNNTDMMRLMRVPVFLRDELGWDMVLGSYDQFQSGPVIQELQRRMGEGFLPNGNRFKRVITRSVEGASEYLPLVNLFRNKRIQSYDCPDLFEELKYLEYHKARGKVDHPETFDNGKVGTKDLSDAFCGAVQNAIQIIGLGDADFDASGLSETYFAEKEAEGYAAVLDVLQGLRDERAAQTMQSRFDLLNRRRGIF